jgi:very-short-patch-repair endonuclease
VWEVLPLGAAVLPTGLLTAIGWEVVQVEAAQRAAVARAGSQNGVITVDQLAAAGLSRHAVAHRVRSGWLRRRHRGVFIVGPVESPLAEAMAAVLAVGGNALLSNYPGGVLWEIVPPPAGPAEVTVVGRDVRGPEGVRVHRIRRLDPADAARRHAIPVTSAARTLLDLATQLTARDLGRAVEEARIHRLITDRSLKEQFERYPRHQGAKALRKAAQIEPARTRSLAERGLLDLIRAARLPTPQANKKIGRHEVDLVWREHSLIVEVDGYAFHSTRAAFERDRRRDAELLALGYRVIRVTWRQIADEPEALVATLAVALAVQRPLPSAFARSSIVSA